MATTLATAGLFVAPNVASADDAETRQGNCSRNADYTMTLRELDRDDRDRLRVRFAIDSPKGDKVWKFRVFRSGNLVATASKRSGPGGNVAITRTFRGDEDNVVRVVARASYGETCKRGFKLDD